MKALLVAALSGMVACLLAAAPAAANHVPPTGLRVVAVDSGSVKLDWDSYIAHSRDYYMVHILQAGAEIRSAERSDESQYTVRSLSSGSTYTFWVTAVVGGVETAGSTALDAALPGPACSSAWGTFGAGTWPSACWTPYARTSPFNRPIPPDPPLLSNSAAIVSRLVGWGNAQSLIVGHPDSYAGDYNHPVYYNAPDDPLFTVQCTRWQALCAVQGMQVRIPDRARPASGADGHMAVIDQRTGWEWDFWQVQSKPAGGGTLVVSHGGRTRVDGDGLGSNATAAHFGLQAGVIRAEEWAAGSIDHALFMTVRCSAGASVYPAAAGTTAASCESFGDVNRDAPPLGARFQLAMTDAEIDALDVPVWKKPILRAMATYGMIVGDTFNYHPRSFGLVAESDIQYRSLGYADRFAEFARQMGVGTYNGAYVFVVDSGVDWGRYLRVVDPCVSQSGC